MASKERREEESYGVEHVDPPYVPNVRRPGDKVTPGPLHEFRQLARDDGKPYKSPEPKAEQGLLAMLGTNGSVVLMGGLLVVVVIIVLVLVATKV
jgi:hypothetical protein